MNLQMKVFILFILSDFNTLNIQKLKLTSLTNQINLFMFCMVGFCYKKVYPINITIEICGTDSYLSILRIICVLH